MHQVYGSTDSIKDSVLEELKALYDLPLLSGELVPREIYNVICPHSEKLNREIAVYLNRKGQVLAVSVGEHNKVGVPDLPGKRDEKRLSGLRCIHTHPHSSGRLSDVDLGTLVRLRLDAMIAIGLVRGDIQVGMLSRNEAGALKETQLSGPYFMRPEPQENTGLNSLFAVMEEIDKEASKAAAGMENEEEGERAILVGLTGGDTMEGSKESLAELEELAKTAGAIVLDKVLQKKDRADTALYIGRGKAEELSLLRQALDANVIIFDEELSGAQTRNLELITGAKVIDRTTLILDIFAQRARSTEGKLQVELAQMKYLLPRLTGRGVAMSRLGGGIGTRGPGETKLETDRRHIHRRIKAIEAQLAEVKKRRGELRNARKRNAIPTASLAGYTNAGKSTIMNALCPAAEVFAENMLFATLDSTVRKLRDPLDQGREALLVDTVGFIRKLPHDLVDAFRSTLEETIYADLILHVVDGANSDFSQHMEVVDKLLCDIGAEQVPIFLVFNKMDKAGEAFRVPAEYGENSAEKKGVKVFCVSAKTGEGMQDLAEAIFAQLLTARQEVTFLIPYTEGAVLSEIHNSGGIQELSYAENGTLVRALVSAEIAGRYAVYLVQEETV